MVPKSDVSFFIFLDNKFLMIECCQLSSFTIPSPLLLPHIQISREQSLCAPSLNPGRRVTSTILCSQLETLCLALPLHHNNIPKPVSFPRSLKPFETNLGGLLYTPPKHLFCEYKHTSFYCTLFYCSLEILSVLQIESLCNPAPSKSMGAFFEKHLITLCLCVTFW